MIRAALALIACALPLTAGAQTVSPLNQATIDTSSLATKAEVQAAQTAATNAAANSCPPSSTVPPMETVGGAGGSATTCRRSDAVQPRITRAKSCTLVSGGTCTVTYEALPSSDPNIIAVAINSGAQPIMCGPTAAATTTSVSIKCFVTQPTTLPALATSLLGLLIPVTTTAPAGTVVQITALPKN